MTDRAALAARFRYAASVWKGTCLAKVDVSAEVCDLDVIADALSTPSASAGNWPSICDSYAEENQRLSDQLEEANRKRAAKAAGDDLKCNAEDGYPCTICGRYETDPCRMKSSGDARAAVIAALARRLCQLFDSGGESQRSVRARHASAIFQFLNRDDMAYLAEQARCDMNPVAYLQEAEAALSQAPATDGPAVTRPHCNTPSEGK